VSDTPAGRSLMDHYTLTGRPFPRNVYRVLRQLEVGPVTNRSLSNVLVMSRQMTGAYLSRCFRRGYALRNGNIYTISAAGVKRLAFLKQNDPDNS